MKRLLLAACLMILTAQQAAALSCLRPTIEDAHIRYSQAKEQYILVTGILSNKRNVVQGPLALGGAGSRSENFVATLVGHQASRSGFDRPINITVAVSTICLASWCGTVNTDAPILTFLEVTAYGHNLSEGPCGGTVFYNPDKDMKRRALQCLRGGVCTPPNR